MTEDIGVHETAWARSPLDPGRSTRRLESIPGWTGGLKPPVRRPCEQQVLDLLELCQDTSSATVRNSLPGSGRQPERFPGGSGAGASESRPAGGEGEELWLVSTRFSCLCTLHPDYSFVPRWRPPFITALTAEDRCHLNGLAIVDGRPKYATALGETDTAGGWRPDKAHGGCLMDVPSGEILARGLSMPHSPRWQSQWHTASLATGHLDRDHSLA